MGARGEEKPCRHSADIISVHRPILVYVSIHVYTYIIYIFINKYICVYCGRVIIMFTDTAKIPCGGRN
jgi:hypothetical protein